MISDRNVIKISVPLDDDGFLDLECPFCGESFKLLGNDYEDEDIFQIFCPFCGLVDDKINYIMNKDFEDHITTLAENFAKDMINKSFKDMENSFRENKNISLKKGDDLKMEKPKKLIALNDLIEYEMRCCDKQIKVVSENMGVFCPFCGVK